MRLMQDVQTLERFVDAADVVFMLADYVTIVQDVKTLERLIDAADVVFMLTDSRESRWLPTLLCAASGTLLINAALGFDSWIVMRHGLRTDGFSAADQLQDPLGCYFCNDVVAPANSATGRSMDEQCTVVRPGLARIAAAHAVELHAALSQHPAGAAAPTADGGAALGAAPHMLRGCVTGFTQTEMKGLPNECCSASSAGVLAAYRAEGSAFVLRAVQVRADRLLV